MNEAKEAPRRPWDKRAFTALLMFFSFLWLVPSGFVMHFAGLSETEPFRHLVMSVHNVSSLLFLVSVVIHVVLNWKPMARHFSAKTREYSRLRKELLVAALLVTALVLAFGSHGLHLR